MDADQLKTVMENHAKWLRNEGGERANLVDANLVDANLVRSNLAHADLVRANLVDANLVDANLAGVLHVISAGQRRDGYHFYGWVYNGDLMIRAGCRNMTIAAYREHNARRDDAALRAETTAILDHIEQVAKARGLVP